MDASSIGDVPDASRHILRTYVTLTLLSTFASSFIWGINTLFLLDAKLSVTEAFAANAFFTAGQVLFEVPTGVVADTFGRRASYRLGAATLFFSTLAYLYLWRIHGPFWAWALVSALLGLGFTFFSGATEAWLVDGLAHAGYRGKLDAAFAKGQIAGGVAMLSGTVIGGLVAQWTNLGVPYLLRSLMLALTFLVSTVAMQDVGFVPKKNASPGTAMRTVVRASIQHGFRNPPVRWMMLAAPLSAGVGFYTFYALQPHLLALYGKAQSYVIAGLAAALIAGMQVAGGFLVPHVHKLFRRRTSLLSSGLVLSALALAALGFTKSFWLALILLALWALVFAASIPARQAYLNGLIPSTERATVLSFDNLLGSTGGVVIQPALGKVADAAGFAVSFVAGAAVELCSLPFLWLARRTQPPSDVIDPVPGGAVSPVD